MVSANKGMKILNQQKELQLKYWDGAVNFLCRLWFYFIRGLEIFDKFKYFFIVFGGLYYLIGKKHLFLMVAVSVVAPVSEEGVMVTSLTLLSRNGPPRNCTF